MALFRKCSSCRGDIQCAGPYWVCSVSTCQRQRTGLFFCSVPCWEAHLPSMRHREAWAVEERAPSAEKWAAQQKAEGISPSAPSPPTPSVAKTAPKAVPSSSAKSSPAVVRRPVVTASATAARTESSNKAIDRDILIVVSKLKKYIRASSGFNTSDTAMDPLSDCVRAICEKAIAIAREDGRKTVMDRDVRAATRD